MIDNQIESRRNIETAAKIRLGLRKADVLAKQAKKRQGERTDLKNNIPPDLAECYGDVRDLIGKEDRPWDKSVPGFQGPTSPRDHCKGAGVSGITVNKFKYIEKNAPKLADDLCTGKVVNKKKLSIDGAYRDLRKEEHKAHPIGYRIPQVVSIV